MKKNHLLGMIMGLIGSLAVSSAQAAESPKELVPNYIAIQKALSADDLEKAKAEAKMLATKNASEKSIFVAAKAITDAKSLSDARKHFKKLSGPFVEWVKKNRPAELDVVYCPMAGASWVQEKGEIANPYFGAQMLSCGEKAS